MENPLTLDLLRQVLTETQGNLPLLIRIPGGRGYHKFVSAKTWRIQVGDLPETGQSTAENWVVLTTAPVGVEASGALVSSASYTLPNLDSVPTVLSVMAALAVYDEYNICVADSSGVRMCSSPARVSSVIERGAAIYNKAAVLQLF